MASFFNVGANPFSTPIGQRIEQATDGSLQSENWALNMEICDLINESSDTARDAMKAIRKRLLLNAGKNNQVILYTLTVLETCVKNCGKAFHVLVSQKDFIQELVKLIGPKNDPPAIIQEKVLNLIQIWSDTFKNQPDLNGVTQVYMELKNKGIEFPQADLNTMAPIYTPQRSVPDVRPQQVEQQTMSPHHTSVVSSGAGQLLQQQPPPPAPLQQQQQPPLPPQQQQQQQALVGGGINVANTITLTPEQITKLQSEAEIVAHSASIFSEMLNELKPGHEDPEDYELLTQLSATCREMQGRLVELIGRISDDNLTAEFLRLNDELNNLFLRHHRYENNRSQSSSSANTNATNTNNVRSPSALLGAAIGVPQQTQQSSLTTTTATVTTAASAATNDTNDTAATINSENRSDSLLIDLIERNGDKLPNAQQSAPPSRNVDEFDMLAQSRTDGISNRTTTTTESHRNIPTGNLTTVNVSSPFKRSVGDLPVPSNRNEFDEMEAWLGNTKLNDSGVSDGSVSAGSVGVGNVGVGRGIGGTEEILTSTEFDKFLEERAAAAESLPTIATIQQNASSVVAGSIGVGNVDDDNARKTQKSTTDKNDLLSL